MNAFVGKLFTRFSFIKLLILILGFLCFTPKSLAYIGGGCFTSTIHYGYSIGSCLSASSGYLKPDAYINYYDGNYYAAQCEINIYLRDDTPGVTTTISSKSYYEANGCPGRQHLLGTFKIAQPGHYYHTYVKFTPCWIAGGTLSCPNSWITNSPELTY